MKNIPLTQDFFLGGKAIFTLSNRDTGEHRTYMIKKSKPNARYPNPAFFVRLLTGPNNTSDYQYLGKLRTISGTDWLGKEYAAGTVHLTGESKLSSEAAAVKGIRYLMGRVFGSGQIHDQMEVAHAGKCGRCGRLLTTPESLERGIGPECWSIMGS